MSSGTVYGSLSDRCVLVTGAGHGIGRAVARRFAEQGCRVVVNDVDEAAAGAVVDEIGAEGGTASASIADVSDADAVGAMFDDVAERHGALDVLVNNAGLVSPMLHVLEADEAWWRRIVDVNLTGHFLCSRRAAHAMAQAGSGVILNTSSGGATRAHRCFTAYDATKGGIEALTRAMALDLGPYGIRVNALMPGSIDTSGDDGRSRRDDDLPLGRIGDPDDVAGAALFLASDDASYITGHVVRIDGGMLAQQRSATVDLKPPSGFPTVERR